MEYGDLALEARVAFGRAKLGGSYRFPEKPPSQLDAHSFVITDDAVYALEISKWEHITERMATLFGGTITALIGVFVSWLDVVSGFRSRTN